MKVYSPDHMSAEAEYLAATSGAGEGGGVGAQTQTFGIPAAFSMAASLKEAAGASLICWVSHLRISPRSNTQPSVWVSAPISGIIVRKNVVRGQAVNPGDQLFAWATLQWVWITADIYQDDLSRVYVGQPLEAVTASYPAQLFKARFRESARPGSQQPHPAIALSGRQPRICCSNRKCWRGYAL